MSCLKGCINKKCETNKNKQTYPEKFDYCPKCGERLYYVCKECYTQLPDGSKQYCELCWEKKQNAKEKAVDAVAALVDLILNGGAAVKNIADTIGKFSNRRK